MSTRLRVADLKAPSARIAEAINVTPEDPRFLAWANVAEETMVNQGRWFGSVVECQFTVGVDGCFVLPPEVATLERIAINGQNVDIVNGWMPFTRLLTNVPICQGCCSGAGGSSGGRRYSCGHLPMVQKEGTAVSFNRTVGEHKRLRVYPTINLDVGKFIVFQGYNSAGVWVKTVNLDGVTIDGEQVELTLPFKDTVTEWAPGSPLGVAKDVTYRHVPVFEYDTVTGVETAIADYQPGETNPTYRIAYIPNLCGFRNGSCCEDTGRRTLTALAKLWHVELRSDGDWLVLQNLAAYKAAMIAVKAYEEGDVAKGDYYLYGRQAAGRNARGVTRVVNRGGALPLLNAELRTNSSDRVSAFIRLDETDKFPALMAGFI